jgi:cytochrome c556
MHDMHAAICLGPTVGPRLSGTAVYSGTGQDDEAFVQYRQKVMSANGASMGAINDILKNKLPYQGHIATHAQDIQRISTLIAEAFKKEVTAGKTDAKPEIWKDWEKFAAAAKAMGEESGKLAEVARAGNMEAIGAQVKKLGDACGDCHKPFRKPREESYKRQQ